MKHDYNILTGATGHTLWTEYLNDKFKRETQKENMKSKEVQEAMQPFIKSMAEMDKKN